MGLYKTHPSHWGIILGLFVYIRFRKMVELETLPLDINLLVEFGSIVFVKIEETFKVGYRKKRGRVDLPNLDLNVRHRKLRYRI